MSASELRRSLTLGLMLLCVSARADHKPEHLCTPTPAAIPVEHRQWQEQQREVGTVTIGTRPIFNEADPDENNWAFRWVNRLHVDTRPKVLADDLLLEEGKPFNATALAESERILRQRKYLREASIKASENCEGKIDLNVQAREVWTLLPELGYSHKGGATTTRFGLKDNNFLGTGKSLSLKREDGVDRTSTELGYNDPNWGALRGNLSLDYGDTSDGNYYNINLTRPFYSLDTPWAASVMAHQATLVDRLFLRGDEIQAFEHEEQHYGLQYGVSKGLIDNQTIRWTLGYAVTRDQFAPTTDTVPGQPLPDNRHYSYPWLGWEWQQNEFVKAVNVNQINLVEDLNLGWTMAAKLGYSSNFLEPAQDAIVFDGNAERSWLISDDKVVVFAGGIKGYYENNRFSNNIAEVRARYHHGDFLTHQFYAQIHALYGANLFVDKPMYLGAEDGMRGYPLRYQVGERTAILTLEQRWFTSYEFLKLFDVGAAAFYDLGRAWAGTNGMDSTTENDGWLQAAGFGLRLSPTRVGSSRSGRHNVIHIDLAFPFDQADDVKRWQFSLQVKDSF